MLVLRTRKEMDPKGKRRRMPAAKAAKQIVPENVI